MKTIDLFNISYGNGFSLNSLDKDENGISFVSRTSKNNGVSDRVKKLPNVEPFRLGLITVSVSGSVLESFIQTRPFYTGYHVMVLEPKKEMSTGEKLFYCLCIKRNKYKYSYGRQANRTLKDIKLPDILPQWIYEFNTSKFEDMNVQVLNNTFTLNDRKWKKLKYGDVFEIERGHYNKRPSKKGDINFVSATRENNGVTDKLDREVIERIYEKNCIIVVNNGASTSCAFYQAEDFTCSHDVNILRIKNGEMNPFIAMFLIPIIRKEKYRFNYGRKWRYERMQKSELRLPIDNSEEPDWSFMEQYIKSLPYSSPIN